MKLRRWIAMLLALLLVFNLLPTTALAEDGDPEAGVLLTGSGTPDDPYLIHNADDWNTFAENVRNGINANKYYKLADDYNSSDSVSTYVGTADHPFAGDFNGNGKTLKVYIDEYRTGMEGAAPFRYIAGAAIHHLTVTGRVYGGPHSAGLVGYSWEGSSSIYNCEINTNVSSNTGSMYGGSYIGGVVGHAKSSELTLRNVIYSGEMYHTGNYAGGLVGWNDNSTLKFINCIFKGRYVSYDACFHPVTCKSSGANVTVGAFENVLYTLGDTGNIPGDNLVAGAGGVRVTSEKPEGIYHVYNAADGITYYTSVTLSGLSSTYTGRLPDPLGYVLTDSDGTQLIENTDFTVSKSNIKDDYELTFTGIGNFGGTKTFSFTVLFSDSSGTEEAPYLIHNADDWNTFAQNINAGVETDKYYKLADDFDNSTAVSVCVGTADHPFAGIFDGNGKTLNVNINESASGKKGTAPFRYIAGATIKNLNVAGSVTNEASGEYPITHAAGLAGYNLSGNSLIENCRIDAKVKCREYLGGVVGNNSASLTLRNVVFGGEVCKSATISLGVAGGLVGWNEDGTSLTLENCLFIGSFTDDLNYHPVAVKRGDYSVTVSSTNVYYTSAPYMVNMMDGSTNYAAAADGDLVTAQQPSGGIYRTITAVDGNDYYVTTVLSGLRPMYLINEDNIAQFTLKEANGYTLKEGTDYNAHIIPGIVSPGVYRLSIFGIGRYGNTSYDYDFTVLDGVSYIDADGTEKKITSASSITFLSQENAPTEWNSGWYVVSENMTIGNRIKVNGNVKLILFDGLTLNSNLGITVDKPDGGAENVFTVYGQSEQTGRLNIDIRGTNYYTGIGNLSGQISDSFTSVGSITINGGVIDVRSGPFAAAIGCGQFGYNGGSVTINGGTVNAYGSYDGPGIGGGISNGPSLSSITINGGKVTASAERAKGIGGGSCVTTLNWTKTSDSITASYSGTVILAKDFDDTEGNHYSAANPVADSSVLDGKTLIPPAGSWEWLQAAVVNAPNGSTLTLTQNYIGNDSVDRLLVATGKTLTIDLNGYMINRNRSTVDNNGHVIVVQTGATLTIKDSSGNDSGVITGGYAYNGGGINNSGTLNIEGGTITGNRAVRNGDSDGRGGGIANYGTLNISGGVITGNSAYAGGGIGVRPGSTANSCVVNITGGSITNNTANEAGAISSASNGDSSPVIDLSNVNITGNKAEGSGGAIRIWAGTVTLNSGTISGNEAQYGGAVHIEEKGIFNLYGGTISGNTATGQGGGIILLNNVYSGGGKLNIKGSPVVQANTAGQGSSAHSDNVYLRSYTFMTVTGALGTNAQIGVTAETESYAVTQGFSVYNQESALSCFTADPSDHHVCIYENEVDYDKSVSYVMRKWEDGQVKSETKYCDKHIEKLTGYDGNRIIQDGWYYISGSIVIDGSLLCNGSVNLILCDGCELTVKGLYGKEGHDLCIFGQANDSGKIVSEAKDGNAGLGGTKDYKAGEIIIYGGTIEATGDTNAAGIGGGNHDSGYQGIRIYGGNITAIGGSSGAGIGKGQQNPYSKTGHINIYGGNIEAKCDGSWGAGIGGGEDVHGGIINIYGGKIRAVGGDGGAGIGGGGSCDDAGQVVTIYGGEIEALCMYDGAGIGGGTRSDMGTVIINGGEIKATGGEKSAGIGGGNNGKDGKGQIIINDGKVEANGGKEGPGIGAGHDSYIESITINGGTVYAYPGSTNESTTDNYPAAIGGCASEAFRETITISGGYIWAETETMAAAIGSGYRREFAGQIIITGGNVNANAGTDPICEYAGAGIGSGANGKFTSEGLVKITGGQVNAFSYAQVNAGAGIGSGGLANMEGTVQITGGYVEAGSFLQNPEQYVVGGKAGTGAGIGSGCESQSTGGGGEFKGKIYIDGGEVLAYTDDPDARAIGAGHEGDTNGEFRLYSTARVYAGIYEDNHPYYSRIYLINYDQRISSFSNMCVFIEQCEHEERTYTVLEQAEDGHEWICGYCGSSGREVHVMDSQGHCTLCGYTAPVGPTTAPTFVAHSLSLGGDIGVNFFIDLNGQDPNDLHAVFTWGAGQTQTVQLSTLTAISDGSTVDGCYKLTALVAAKEMTDEITVKVYKGDEQVSEDRYSVASYARRIIDNQNGEFSDLANYTELKALCEAMLVYGAKAQTQFNYNIDNLADAGLIYTLETVPADSLDEYVTANLNAFGIVFEGSSLVLETKTTHRLYFSSSKNAQALNDTVQVKCGNTVLKFKDGTRENAGMVYVDITDIAAKNVLKNYTVRFSNDGFASSTPLKVNAGAYIYNVLITSLPDPNGRVTQTLKDVVSALYWYSTAAEAYFSAS